MITKTGESNGYAGYKEDVRTLQADKNILGKAEEYLGAALSSFESIYHGVPIIGSGISIDQLGLDPDNPNDIKDKGVQLDQWNSPKATILKHL